ncbi:MAG: hypothetical protein WAK48_00780 [Candidatus Acidiferrum sp.]|jgi:hypothetical protein
MVVARISGGFSLRNFRFCSCCVLLLSFAAVPARMAAQDAGPMRAPEQQAAPATKRAPVAPKSKKLILKDGTFQVVREYQVNGDRVRYFSEERGAWEELPAALVDWDATARDEASSQKAANALAEKVHDQEEAKRLDNVSDIDASLQVGQGAFLPSAEGLFVVEGKTVRSLKQVEAGSKKDKLRTVEQVLSPIPIVPGKQRVYIAGEHAMLRLKTTTPEFYLREAPPDPDRVARIETSSRPGESGPDVMLIRAKEIKNGRELESIKTLFGEKIGADVNEVAIQRWEVAPNVYRFTLGEALTPGEYVVAEVLSDGLNYFVWDFGVDGSGSSGKK